MARVGSRVVTKAKISKKEMAGSTFTKADSSTESGMMITTGKTTRGRGFQHLLRPLLIFWELSRSFDFEKNTARLEKAEGA